MPEPARPLATLPPLGERALLCAVLLAFFGGGYYAVAGGLEPGRAHVLAPGALDRHIPFVPGAIYVYALAYTAALFPAFVVGCRQLFRRVAAAYTVTIAVALGVFAAWPVSTAALRPDPGSLDGGFAAWGVRLLYALDPPGNALPSLHVALVWLAVASAWRVRPALGSGAALVALAISASTTLVKQHYVVDVAAGAALAAGVAALLLRGSPPPGPRPRGGLALFVALVAGLYAAFYAAFRAGWTA